ncbi:MAG: hypoxanthine phosphoribosyltransferase [Candidatus Solincola sediminis]|uniref:Hypoxanthine phosphoribosyltransferase n=1 Tax=Candidatus Solincola sediminis TaxID=1797199 RepID=A0A1F2WGH5_9ACTN|nr:MAG: hypoxanthine phosphoribosyltransferase [Candidatus Solincola sediminis]OFW56220.1 MAG: hypoxanthine phosphoribosyltransferase [Candidatus Solincola sediminis]
MNLPFAHRVIFSEDEIADRVQELGREITAFYKERQGPAASVVIVSMLKGAFVFLADLMRYIELDLSVDFMAISSYGATDTKSGVRIEKDLSGSIYNQNVMIVEDIIDTGLTLSYILRNLKSRAPAEIKICTLLDRAVARIAPIEIDYRGFEVGREFFIGYGLDYRQKWRNLKYICSPEGLEEENGESVLALFGDP